MEDKQLLITSMQKLIKHIGVNKKNQEDIFKSLSNIDLIKIVSNLDDPTPQLRKTSYQLIISLLFDNFGLKKQFCQKIGVGQIKGRIILNPKMLGSINSRLPDLIKILKQPLTTSQSNYTVWYLNVKSFPRKIQYLNHISNSTKIIDPKQNLVGIILPEASIGLLKNEGPMINNLIQASNNLQKKNSNKSDQPIHNFSASNNVSNSFSNSIKSYSKKQQPEYSHSYTANTINNYNTHNNYFTILHGTESSLKQKDQGFKQLKNVTVKDSKNSLRQNKEFKQLKTKEAPISIKKLNFYSGKTQYASKNQTRGVNMYQSTQLSSDKTQIKDKEFMGTSNMINNNQFNYYNMTNSLEQDSKSSSSPYGNNRRSKPVSVMIKDAQRVKTNNSQIIMDNNNSLSNENIKKNFNNYNNSPQVPNLQIKNRYLQSPIQSVPDRNSKDINSNLLKYYKKY